MRKRPLLLCACVFVSGLFYEKDHSFAMILCVAVLMIDAVLPLLKRKQTLRGLIRVIWIPLMFLLGVFHMREQNAFREAELAQIQEGKDIALCGEIFKKEIKQDRYRFYLKNCYAVSMEKQIACNCVLLAVDSDMYAIGDILWVNGKVNRFKEATNEGAFDARLFYERQKIDFMIKSPQMALAQEARWKLPEHLWKMKKMITFVYQKSMDVIPAGVMSVMVAGEKSTLDEETKELYQVMGISHILAISGLHVSLIGLGIYRFLRRRGIRYAKAFLIAGSMICLYAVMTGESVSTIRATGMLLLMMLSELWGRAYDLLNALGCMCLYLLWDNPYLLDYAGFWLSVMAVFSTATIVRAIQIQKYPSRKNLQKIINAAYSGIGIWLFTLPLIAFYYYEVPLYSALLNLFIVPFLAILLFLGVLGAVVGVLGIYFAFPWEPLSSIILLPCKWILCWYELAASACLKLPNTRVIVGKPSFQRMLFFYLVLFLFAYVWKWKKERHGVRLVGIVCCLLILFMPGTKEFELSLLDVGQGDGIYICTKEGHSLFIDGGSSNLKNVGNYQILPFLKSKGIKKIDYWFVSHFDADHVNGLMEVMESGYPIEHLVIATYSNAAERRELLTLAENNNITVLKLSAGQQLTFEKTVIICLGPWEQKEKVEGNDASLILLYRDSDFSGIFAGDISEQAEKKLVDQYEKSGILNVDFYKVNHHGSKYSSSASWLSAISPKIAVVSCSRTNMYGHPAPEAVKRIEDFGAKVYYTMIGGRIRCQRNRQGKLEVDTYLLQGNEVE